MRSAPFTPRPGRAPLVRFVICLVPVVAFDAWFTRGILEATSGRLCPILDDAFIHYQYARSVAELHPLAYHPGDVPTTGATSLLYPALLALGWLGGFRGLALSWFAHGLSAIFVALSMTVAWGFADRFVHRAAGPAAALSVVACPSYLLFCLGGMEIGVSSSLHLMATLVALGWFLRPEARVGAGATARALGVALLGGLAALGRPEGAAAAAVAALAIAWRPPNARASGRLWAALAVAPAFVPGAVAYATTGVTRTNGVLLKLVAGSPYASAADVAAHLQHNAHILWERVFAGLPSRNLVIYQAVPHAFRELAIAGLALFVVYLVLRRGREGALAFALYLVSASAVLAPLFYTWLGNLGRYVIAYVPMLVLPLVLGAGGLVVALGERARLRPRLVEGTALVATLGLALVFVVEPSRARAEHVEAAREMCAQQVPMAEAVRALPPTAVIALNDAGAIAYLGGHRTWDMVGLTSFDAARARLSGDGSVFERMERLPPGRRPTHLAYYPAWFPGLRIAGARLHRTSATGIYVGMPHAELFEIRAGLFGSGATPRADGLEGAAVDELDVGDLASEAAHGYAAPAVRAGGASFRVADGASPLAEGGRRLAPNDRFELEARPGVPARLVVRLAANRPSTLDVIWNGAPLSSIEARPRGMTDHVLAIPAERVRARNTVERRVRAGAALEVFHDWLYQ